MTKRSEERDQDGAIEHAVAARVLTTLLRERFGSIGAQVSTDGHLELADRTRVPLMPGTPFDDFRVEAGSAVPLSVTLDTVAAVADPDDEAGVADFTAECAAEVTSRRLYRHHRADVEARLHDDLTPIAADALAAAIGHPFHPTSLARVGLSEADVVAYSPEFAPRFRLRWAAVDVDRAIWPRLADPPAWWPSPATVGLPPHERRPLFPVHPLTIDALPAIATLAPRPYLDVRPTLSMRTVQVDDTTHLKLPIPVSTLGLRNRRTITPASLADGARAGRLLRRVLPDDVLVADEDDTDHTGHPLVARLIRRLPVADAVSVAALPAPVPGGGTVADVLAVRHAGGSRHALVDRYLTRLLAWQADLLVRHGIALESHQQNLAVRFAPDGGPVFVVKDHDAILVSPRLLEVSGLDVPEFTDPRAYTDDTVDLADVFVTITVHLAAAAIAFALLPVAQARRLLRRALSDALAPHGDHPVAALLRSRTLDAGRLVAKRMITAATLVDKAKTGARDINKCYGTDAPNYLAPTA